MAGPNWGRELSLLWIPPFAGMLLAIALCPLLVPHFWETHRNKAIVAAFFALPTRAIASK